jgi:hypothetical protein
MDTTSVLLEQWKAISELHRHQDGLIWQQFNYFTALNIALISGQALLWSQQTTAPNAVTISKGIAILGLIVGLSWLFAQGRQQAYQTHWFNQVKEIEFRLSTVDRAFHCTYHAKLSKSEYLSSPPWGAVAWLPIRHFIPIFATLTIGAWAAALFLIH